MIIFCNGFEYHIDTISDEETALLLASRSTIFIDTETKRVILNRISGERGAIGALDHESCDWIKRHRGKHCG